MSTEPFKKFMRSELTGAKKKEALRQEKKQLKQQAREKKRTAYKTATKQNTPSSAPSASIVFEEMPLNKFIAHAGVCSRREAAQLVKSGAVTVNKHMVTEPAYKVKPKDVVEYKGKKLFLKKNLVYILLNKPKDYLTTLRDPQGRKTVYQLIQQATNERVYPVGRLDRNTTGVLLLTNDGELAQKLTHPSFEIKKVYEVKLDKPLTKKDFETIMEGIVLEDGFIRPDSMAYADKHDKSIVGIEIHSGRNRIVRRMFEHLGYKVKNLDRVMFAGLTKKNVERGKWRFLTEKEVRILKHLNQSFLRKREE
jgi:23S rRNA pseudouridine2605 synthase